MSAFNHQPSITLSTHRCHDCGLFYAIEDRIAQCPYCASRRIGNAYDEANAAKRSANSLRGALTRLRNK